MFKNVSDFFACALWFEASRDHTMATKPNMVKIAILELHTCAIFGKRSSPCDQSS